MAAARAKGRIEEAAKVPADRRIAVVLLDGHFASSRSIFCDIFQTINQIMVERQLGSGFAMGIRTGARATVAAFHIDLLSVDGLPVRASDGARVPVVGSLPMGIDYGLVFVPATVHRSADELSWLTSSAARTSDFLIRQWKGGALLAAAGSGVFALAEAGLLDRRPTSVSWWLRTSFQRQYGRVPIDVEAPVSEVDHIFCAGPLGAEPLLSCRLMQQLSPQWVADVAANFVLLADAEMRESSDRDMIAQTDDPLVLKAQLWIGQHYSDKHRLADLARRLAVSERTLLRRFLAATGMTPHAYIRKIRLDVAERMVVQMDLPLHRIATHVGYSDVDFFKRIFKEYRGMSPVELRRNRH